MKLVVGVATRDVFRRKTNVFGGKTDVVSIDHAKNGRSQAKKQFLRENCKR